MLDDVYPQVRCGPPRPSAVLEPRVFSLPPGVERHTVRGRGALLVQIAQGDRLTVVCDEGGQPCEIVAAGRDGRIDVGLLGAAGDADAAGLKALLIEGDDARRRLRRGIEARGIDLGRAGALRLFGPSTPAGSEESFTAQADATVIVAAPGGRMDFERQDAATPLTVWIRRASPRAVGRFALPDPLADPLDEIRVASQTARAYTVRAGDYFQVIDVDGRQCTDLQCFSARKLDAGIERPIDVTTTRSIMSASYPMPGLHAKYYDRDMTPLVEVVQDTCGRHDAFALACNAKYYDDMGYFAHPNCSDNFNAALAPFDVGARPGWMAVNIFFNSAIDEHGVLSSDEPWSRPGDYVLMRALTDLVCVSSACPDDTSPSNGWSPSDIHVRTYPGAERFSRATARRVTPDSEAQMTKETGFHDRFAEHTRNFVEYKGYWLANCFGASGPIEEYWACRKAAVIMDLSALRKWEITGPDAEALCQYAFTRDMKKLGGGQVVYTAMCYPHGGMIDDGTVFRLDRDRFRWIGGDEYGGVWLREHAEAAGLDVLIRSSTDQMHNVAVQGPESRDILSKIVWTAPQNPRFDQLGWFRFTNARVGDEQGIPIVVSRTGYTGELGYEVFCNPADAPAVFDAIWEAGQGHGLVPMGLEALDMVRIEAGLIFAGYDFCDQTDPFEAGIGFTVPLKSKEDDFIGRDALIRRKTTPARKLVGLDVDTAIMVNHGDGVFLGRAQVGVVTSAMRSPGLGKSIALARMDVACSEVGTRVEVGKLDGHQKRLPAEIVPFAHYDPKKERPRA